MDSSRRSFLKSAGLLSAGLLVQGFDVPLPVGPRRKQNDDITHWDGSKLGRMQLNVTTVYAEPTWRSAHKGWYYYDDVVPIKQAVVGVGLYPSNSTWLEIDGGYIYSSWVQPVSEEPPNPVERIGPRGAWGVVTVPKTESRSGPGDEHFRREIMVYGTVHQIIEEQNGYYLGEGVYGGKYWLNAKDVRIIKPEEIEPISPDVPPEEKRIEISLRQQRLWAYEGDEEVFTHLVATGVPNTPTPTGEYYVRLKRIGQRMSGGMGDMWYNLPGVPWICYFTPSFAATHGTYWHNDYGRVHSNGCVNMPAEAAKWLYRWTTPVADYYTISVTPDEKAGQPGTTVIVRY